MFFPSPRTLFIRRAVSTGFAILITLACALSTKAQMSGIDPDPGDRGTGGRSTIQGRVFFPSGRTVDHRLKVTMTSVGTADFFTYTDDSGAFAFRRLSNGTYMITVDAGREYLLARETVVIAEPSRRTSIGQVFTVQLQLQIRDEESNRAALLDAALVNVPKPARDEYQKAIQSEHEGDSKKALEHLKNAVNIYPQFMLAYNELGVQYFRLGQLDDAAAALNQAVRVDPTAFSPRLNYGIVLFYKKQYQDADTHLAHALSINETSARAHLFRGRTFIRLNDLARAEREFLRAVALGGSADINEAHRFLGGIYREQGNYARAVEQLETYLKLVPNTHDAEQIRQIIKELRSKMTASRS
ncbi:MAG TPA: tetratricopeptide repeat protein [Pyrinomonadaceae bacterium]|nr:tetratricopeptide repeat protein [Pyrinomonadaceae bacterium]